MPWSSISHSLELPRRERMLRSPGPSASRNSSLRVATTSPRMRSYKASTPRGRVFRLVESTASNATWPRASRQMQYPAASASVPGKRGSPGDVPVAWLQPAPGGCRPLSCSHSATVSCPDSGWSLLRKYHNGAASAAKRERQQQQASAGATPVPGFESRHIASHAMGRSGGHQAGNTSDTHSPPPSRLRRAMRPPCASAISRASARPSPVPWRLVE